MILSILMSCFIAVLRWQLQKKLEFRTALPMRTIGVMMMELGEREA